MTKNKIHVFEISKTTKTGMYIERTA